MIGITLPIVDFAKNEFEVIPPLSNGGYVREEFTPEIERFGEEILRANRNIIVALGNTAMSALLARTAISKFRWATELSTLIASGYKVLPTYHPSAATPSASRPRQFHAYQPFCRRSR